MELSTYRRRQVFKLEDSQTSIICFNPTCQNKIPTTIEQKQDFLISFTKKYDSTVLPACSEECQEAIVNLMGERSKLKLITGKVPSGGREREKALKEKKGS